MSTLLSNLIKTPVSEAELLACANHRNDGVLAKLSRHQLQMLCDEGGLVVAPYSVEGTGLPTEEVLRIARFTVGLALYKLTDPAKVDFNARRTKYAKFTKAILDNHNTRLATATTKSQAAKAQRSANTMTDTTEVTETTEAPKHEGKGKKTATKTAAKSVPAKAPAKTATKTAAKSAPAKSAAKNTESDEPTNRYANDTRKIKVINKENPHREGTGRYLAFEECKKSKTVADYAATGHKPKYLGSWTDSGHIELV